MREIRREAQAKERARMDAVKIEKIRRGVFHDGRIDCVAGNGVMSELGIGDERMDEDEDVAWRGVARGRALLASGGDRRRRVGAALPQGAAREPRGVCGGADRRAQGWEPTVLRHAREERVDVLGVDGLINGLGGDEERCWLEERLLEVVIWLPRGG
ncbi:hypothetical protein C8R47DRAFT_1298951 [Mycena vitilis]|nr:hypothetical protein C8R47DRAFT_1298951 [Mycena vitilis]